MQNIQVLVFGLKIHLNT